jgi:hypothetical protein
MTQRRMTKRRKVLNVEFERRKTEHRKIFIFFSLTAVRQ